MNNRITLRLLALYLLLQSSLVIASEFEEAADSYRNNNYAVAFPAFTRLAEQNDARAQTVLALMYKYGEGTPENHQKAFEWYERAAELNYPPAQFNLGIMYQEGLGTEKNPELAIHWYQKAASGGFDRANTKLEELNARTVPSNVVVDPSVPWPDTWNFRLPNSHRDISPGESGLPNIGSLSLQRSSLANRYRVQLGAMSTPESAERLWRQLVSLSPKLFANHKMFIETSRSQSNPVYRLQTGPFSSQSMATDFCREFRKHNIKTGCLPLLSTRD